VQEAEAAREEGETLEEEEILEEEANREEEEILEDEATSGAEAMREDEATSEAEAEVMLEDEVILEEEAEPEAGVETEAAKEVASQLPEPRMQQRMRKCKGCSVGWTDTKFAKGFSRTHTGPGRHTVRRVRRFRV
jgi:hypothetical protein